VPVENACGHPVQACPLCGELTCLSCEDWRRHHSLAGRACRAWWRFRRRAGRWSGWLARLRPRPAWLRQHHVIYCRGCQRAWIQFEDQDAGTAECACTCTPGDPLYEEWLVDPGPGVIPAQAWD
jgi:hypothetical protein